MITRVSIDSTVMLFNEFKPAGGAVKPIKKITAKNNLAEMQPEDLIFMAYSGLSQPGAFALAN